MRREKASRLATNAPDLTPGRKRTGGERKRDCHERNKRKNGGAEGNRTPDLVIANDALSQLSYGPNALEAAFTSAPAGLSSKARMHLLHLRRAAWPANCQDMLMHRARAV